MQDDVIWPGQTESLCKLWVVHTIGWNGNSNTSTKKYLWITSKQSTDAKSLAHVLHCAWNAFAFDRWQEGRNKRFKKKLKCVRVSPCSCLCVEREYTCFALCMCLSLRRVCKPAFRAFILIAMVGYLDYNKRGKLSPPFLLTQLTVPGSSRRSMTVSWTVLLLPWRNRSCRSLRRIQ